MTMEAVKVKDTSERAALFAKLARVMGKLNDLPQDAFNNYHKYHYTSAKTVLSAIRKAMSEENIAVIPNVVQVVTEGKLYIVTYEFTFVCGDTGSTYTTTWYGEAQNVNRSGRDDKALNKCATTAQKYFLLKTFLVGTGDEPDADQDAPVQQQGPQKQQCAQTPTPTTEMPQNGAQRDTAANEAWPASEADARKFYAYWTEALSVPAQYITAALKTVQSFTSIMDWTRGKDKAAAAVIAWYHEYNIDAIKSWLGDHTDFDYLLPMCNAVIKHVGDNRVMTWEDAYLYSNNGKENHHALKNSVKKHHASVFPVIEKRGLCYALDFISEHYPLDKDKPTLTMTPEEEMANQEVDIHRIHYRPARGGTERYEGEITWDGITFFVTVWPEDKTAITAAGYDVDWNRDDRPTELKGNYGPIPVLLKRSKEKKQAVWEILEVKALDGTWKPTKRAKAQEAN